MEVKIDNVEKMLEKEVGSAGEDSARVYLPKEWENRKVKVLLIEEENES